MLANDIVSPKTGEVLYAADTTLDEEALNTIGEHNVSEIVLKGSAIYEGLNSMSTETIALGAPEENVRKSIKHAMMHEMLGKIQLMLFMTAQAQKSFLQIHHLQKNISKLY